MGHWQNFIKPDKDHSIIPFLFLTCFFKYDLIP